MYERVKILAPILHAAMAARAATSWPTFDGQTLDRTRYVTASEIGRCSRMVWFSKNVPPSEGNSFYWGFAERGHSHEAWIVEQLQALEHDYHWTYIGKDQVSFYDGYQSGTPDGLLQTDDDLLVVDFKSIDPRTKISKLPKPEHLDQVIQNMDLVATCLDVDVSGALLAYSDASDYSKIVEFAVYASPIVGERMDFLYDRAEEIMNATSADQLPAEGMYNGGCTNCQFKAQCSGAVEQQNHERVYHEQARTNAKRIFG